MTTPHKEVYTCSVIGCDFAQGGELHGKRPLCWLEIQEATPPTIAKMRRLCGKVKAEEQRTQEVHNE